MFYCREKELEKMNKRYATGQFQCVVVYGRRRVGKTALINQFCLDKPAIFFSALLEETEQENLKTLSRAIAAFKQTDPSTAPVYRSFEDAFEEITRLAGLGQLVFVIDEYPYLARSKPAISSILQHLIDHVWSRTGLYLILCGSSMRFMENQVLGYQSPLYGRRTAQFKIEPLTYRETAVFHPQLDPVQNALIYGITGGIPHYINQLHVGEDLDAALLENLFDTSAYLFEEPANLLKQELREPAVYNAIITAIAGGASRLSEIASKAGMESGPCAKYVGTLMELGIVKKVTPIAEKPGRKTIYALRDPFFRFWYRFVPPNITAIASGKMEGLYTHAVKEQLNDYMGRIFEAMAMEYLLYYADALPCRLRETGEWWGTDPQERQQIQIDIVGLTDEKDRFLTGSCKFRSDPAGADELALLRRYARVFAGNGRFCHYIFSKGGFTEGLRAAEKDGEVRLIGLDDIYR